MKKKILIPSLLIALFASACANSGPNVSQTQSNKPERTNGAISSVNNDETKYTINFVNNDGETLLCDPIEVSEGATPVYPGETSDLQPVEGTTVDGYSYSFNDWSPKLLSASCDATYQATYTATQISDLTVTWYLDEAKQTQLYQLKNVKYGTVPSYGGSLPTKTGYVFTGWKDEAGNPPHEIKENTNYIAQFKDDPTVQGFDLKITGTGCSIQDDSGAYYSTYSKHFTEAQSITLNLKLDSTHHDFPYEIANIPSGVNYDYDSNNGTLIFNNLNKSLELTATAQNSNAHIDYQYTSAASIDPEVAIRFIDPGSNCVIDWGDKSIDKVSASSVVTHEYSDDDDSNYIIKIFGTANYTFSDESLESLCEGNDHFIKNIHLYRSQNAIIDNQFNTLENLESIELPTNLTKIGANAFKNTKLVSLRIPGTCTTIGAGAFSDCPNLNTLYIPRSVVTVGSNITSVNTTSYCAIESRPTGEGKWDDNWNALSSGVKTPTYWGYDFKDSDTNYDFVNYHSPENADVSLTAIQKYKANDNEVTIPNTHVDRDGTTRQVAMIGNLAFKGKSLTKVTFPDPGEYQSEVKIDDFAFSGCSNLQTIDLQNVKKVPIMGDHVFDGCTALQEEESILVTPSFYDQFIAEPTWANYKKYIKMMFLPVNFDTTHLDITYTKVEAGDTIDFTIKPKTGYQLPTSNFKAHVDDGVKPAEDINIIVNNNVGTFSFDSSATSTLVNVTVDVYKITFDPAGGKIDGSTNPIISYVANNDTPVAPSSEKMSHESDAQYNYVFMGWDPEVTTATEDVVYYAKWQANQKENLTISWYNYDQETKLGDTTAHVGSMPDPGSYADLAYKPHDEDHHYSLVGWKELKTDAPLDIAIKDTSYYAICEVDDNMSITFTGGSVVEKGSEKASFVDLFTYKSGDAVTYYFEAIGGASLPEQIDVSYDHAIEGVVDYKWNASEGALMIYQPDLVDNVNINIIGV